MAVGDLALGEVAWPLRVLLVASAGLPVGSVHGSGRSRGVELQWVADPFTALLMLGSGEAHALVLPTDLEPAHAAEVTASVVSWCDLPVLVALTPGDEAAAVAGRVIEAGCSGLLPVPLEEEHLCAALSRAARPQRGGPGDRLLVGGVSIDLGGLTVTGPSGVRVQLSSMQFACLQVLAEAWPSVVRLEVLADHLGMAGAYGSDRVRRLVARLRHQIAPTTGGPDFIENVRGVGYRLRG